MNTILKNREYSDWIKQLKAKLRLVQLKAAVKVNSELLNFYWELGADIVVKQKNSKWGDKFLAQLSKDLIKEFPDIKGFSSRNLKYIRQWYVFYNKDVTIGQQAAAQIAKQNTTQTQKKIMNRLFQIPWWHNVVIITKCKTTDEALFYVNKTIGNGWSRSVLTHQIEGNLYNRTGKAVNNFDATLPALQSDLAKETLKDPYCFDFLSITEKINERELEQELVNQIAKFLLEMGTGFSFIGKQYKLEINRDEFYVDLLFYHVKLHAYVVVELKTVKFKPEFTGQLNFYVSAIDGMIKTKQDNPTIGILICKSKNNTVVEYALKDIHKPIGVSEYLITKSLPKTFKSVLPTIEEIEAELNKNESTNDTNQRIKKVRQQTIPMRNVEKH